MSNKGTLLDSEDPEDRKVMIELANAGFVQQEPAPPVDIWQGMNPHAFLATHCPCGRQKSKHGQSCTCGKPYR